MRAFSRVVLIASLCLCLAATAFAQETLDELNRKMERLYQEGRYDEAVEFARRSRVSRELL